MPIEGNPLSKPSKIAISALAWVVFAGVVYGLSSIGSGGSRHYNDEEYNPRGMNFGTDTIHYRDSVFVITTQIDTIY